MYQALTGRMPFDGDDLSSLTLNVLHGTAQGLRELRHDCPPRLVRIVDRALARDPERRFASAAQMAAALEDCIGQQASAARSPLYLVPLAKRLQRRAKRLVVSVAVLGGWLLWNQTSPLPSGSTASAGVSNPLVETTGTRTRGAGEDHPGLTRTQLAPQILVSPPLSARAPEDALRPALATPTRSHQTELKSPRGEPIDNSKARLLSRKALALYLHGDLPAAYSAYRQAARADPQEPAAFRGVGLSASRLGKTREARRAFNRYLELAPKAADAQLVKARLAALDQPAGTP
jgi:tetratricopeptide (TPR) repeat protein